MVQMPIEIIDLKEQVKRDFCKALVLNNKIQRSLFFSGIESAFQTAISYKILSFAIDRRMFIRYFKSIEPHGSVEYLDD